jgi:hypothetical protein
MRSAFDYYDREMFFIKPSARPDFVFPMPGGRPKADTTPIAGSADRDSLPLLQTADGLIIFGEYTKIKRLEWETPTIVRQSLIGIDRPSEAEGRDSFFRRTSFCLVQDYPQLRIRRPSPQPLVIRHELRMYDSPRPEWMAFNPELARALGWTPVDESLFGWADENGELMVWSIWWEDGLYQSQPPKFDDDVGEGWAIVGLPQALETIAAHMGVQLKQFIRIEESERVNGARKTNVRLEESPIATRFLQFTTQGSEELSRDLQGKAH